MMTSEIGHRLKKNRTASKKVTRWEILIMGIKFGSLQNNWQKQYPPFSECT